MRTPATRSAVLFDTGLVTRFRDARLDAGRGKSYWAGITTPDVGGTATTKDVTEAVVEAIRSCNV